MRHPFPILLVSLTCIWFALNEMAAADDSMAELAGWVKAAGGDARGLVAWKELHVDGGAAFRTQDAVLLKLKQWPASNKANFPRLNNPTKKIYLLGQPKAELQLRPEPTKWIVSLPKQLPEDAHPVIVVETIGKPHLPQVPERILADDAGIYILPGHKAVTYGEMLRYEPQPHKNTVGYWTKPADWAQWHLKVKGAGIYSLHILQGCGKGQGGSDVGIHVRRAVDAAAGSESHAEPSLRFIVQDTGNFQNFVRRELGNIEFKMAGQFTLEIRPERLAKNAVMDVREVRLVPADGK
ncbi:MAG: hypothetical protein H8E66_01935 [Planctomycetes bacterium]|nr:hypothetical protein [Planctomycetota bacterium]